MAGIAPAGLVGERRNEHACSEPSTARMSATSFVRLPARACRARCPRQQEGRTPRHAVRPYGYRYSLRGDSRTQRQKQASLIGVTTPNLLHRPLRVAARLLSQKRTEPHRILSVCRLVARNRRASASHPASHDRTGSSRSSPTEIGTARKFPSATTMEHLM